MPVAITAFLSQNSVHQYNHYIISSIRRNQMETDYENENESNSISRKLFMTSLLSSSCLSLVGCFELFQPTAAVAESRPETLDIDNFLKTGTPQTYFLNSKP